MDKRREKNGRKSGNRKQRETFGGLQPEGGKGGGHAGWITEKM